MAPWQVPLLLLLLLLVPRFIRASGSGSGSATINLFSGTGVDGFSGDGGSATSADLHTPTGVSLDDSGNLYLTDTVNNRIRRIAKGSGLISTIAGTGSQGSSGDGGPASLASFNQPFGLANKGDSSLYVSDFYNNRVRDINLVSGLVITLAGNGTSPPSGESANGDGGAATGAMLSLPTGLAYHNNFVYISDSGSNKVRKVSLVTGLITTTAGTGVASVQSTSSNGDGGFATAASLNFPTGLAVDASGSYLYICDMGNQKVRRVVLASGIISLVAGTGRGSTAGTSANGDGGQASLSTLNDPYDVSLHLGGLYVYVADYNNHKIRRIDMRTGIIDTAVGCGQTPNLPYTAANGDGGAATSAALSQPSGIAGNDSTYLLYIVDSGSSKVRVAYLPDYRAPTGQPSGQPTGQPSGQPNLRPTGQPSSQPSRQPQASPSTGPTRQSTSSPSIPPHTQASPRQISDAVLYGCVGVGALALLLMAALVLARYRLRKLLSRVQAQDEAAAAKGGGKKDKRAVAPTGGIIDGILYQHLLQVDLDLPAGKVSLQLGFNGDEDPLDAAERFVEANKLPREHVHDLAAWISGVMARRAEAVPTRPAVVPEGAVGRARAKRVVRRVGGDRGGGQAPRKPSPERQRSVQRRAGAGRTITRRGRVEASDSDSGSEDDPKGEELAAPSGVP